MAVNTLSAGTGLAVGSPVFTAPIYIENRITVGGSPSVPGSYVGVSGNNQLIDQVGNRWWINPNTATIANGIWAGNGGAQFMVIGKLGEIWANTAPNWWYWNYASGGWWNDQAGGATVGPTTRTGVTIPAGAANLCIIDDSGNLWTANHPNSGAFDIYENGAAPVGGGGLISTGVLEYADSPLGGRTIWALNQPNWYYYQYGTGWIMTGATPPNLHFPTTSLTVGSPAFTAPSLSLNYVALGGGTSSIASKQGTQLFATDYTHCLFDRAGHRWSMGPTAGIILADGWGQPYGGSVAPTEFIEVDYLGNLWALSGGAWFNGPPATGWTQQATARPQLTMPGATGITTGSPGIRDPGGPYAIFAQPLGNLVFSLNGLSLLFGDTAHCLVHLSSSGVQYWVDGNGATYFQGSRTASLPLLGAGDLLETAPVVGLGSNTWARVGGTWYYFYGAALTWYVWNTGPFPQTTNGPVLTFPTATGITVGSPAFTAPLLVQSINASNFVGSSPAIGTPVLSINVRIVQSKSGVSTASAASLAVAFTNPISPGSFIVLAAGFDPSVTTSTITNDKGDAYTDSKFGTVNNATVGGKSRVGAFFNATAGAKTVTIAFSPNSPISELVLWEVNGLPNPTFDAVVTKSDSTTAPTSGATGALLSQIEAAIGYAISSNTITVPTSGWTGATGANPTGLGSGGEHRVTTSNASLTAGFTQTAGATCQIWCATFMPGLGVVVPVGVTVSSPAFTAPTLKAISNLAVPLWSVGSPGFTAATLKAISNLGAAMVVGSPAIEVPGFGRNLIATNLAAGALSLGTAPLVQTHLIGATQFTVGPPATGVATGGYVLAATVLAVAAPAFSASIFVQNYRITPTGLSPGSPALGAPLGGYNVAAPPALAVAALGLPAPAMVRVIALGASNLVVAPLAIDAPGSGGTYAATGFDVASPTIGSATFNQAAALAASWPLMGSPVLGPPTAYGWLPLTLAVASPALGAPVITQTQVLAISPLVITGPDINGTAPNMSGATAIGAVGLTPNAIAFPAVGLGQRHGLAAIASPVASPAFGAAVLGVTAGGAAVSLDIGTPAIGAATLVRVVGMAAPDLTVGQPAFGAPSVGAVAGGTPLPLAAGSPEFGAPSITLYANPVAVGLVPDSPAIDAPTLVRVVNIAAPAFTIGRPALGVPSTGSTADVDVVSLTTAVPTIGAVTLAIRVNADPVGLDIASPDLPAPDFVAFANLRAPTFTTGRSEVGKVPPQLGQIVAIAAADLVISSPQIGQQWLVIHGEAASFEVGSPEIRKATLGQRNGLTSVSVALDHPDLDAAILRQSNALIARGITVASPDQYWRELHAAIPLAVAGPTIGQPSLLQLTMKTAPVGITVVVTRPGIVGIEDTTTEAVGVVTGAPAVAGRMPSTKVVIGQPASARITGVADFTKIKG